MKNPPLLFLDIECLGLDIAAPIWDLAAIRINGNGIVSNYVDMLIKHEPGDWAETLPASFREDYDRRYDPESAVEPEEAIRLLWPMAEGATVCGSNVGFDMARIEQLAITHEFSEMPWHYHPEDIPTLARGWLNGKGVYPAPPWKSDVISQMCGVDVRNFDRHTAKGDVEWCLALWYVTNAGRPTS